MYPGEVPVTDVMKVLIKGFQFSVCREQYGSTVEQNIGLPFDAFLMVWAMATSGNFPTASIASIHVAEGLV